MRTYELLSSIIIAFIVSETHSTVLLRLRHSRLIYILSKHPSPVFDPINKNITLESCYVQKCTGDNECDVNYKCIWDLLCGYNVCTSISSVLPDFTSTTMFEGDEYGISKKTSEEVVSIYTTESSTFGSDSEITSESVSSDDTTTPTTIIITKTTPTVLTIISSPTTPTYIKVPTVVSTTTSSTITHVFPIFDLNITTMKAILPTNRDNDNETQIISEITTVATPHTTTASKQNIATISTTDIASVSKSSFSSTVDIFVTDETGSGSGSGDDEDANFDPKQRVKEYTTDISFNIATVPLEARNKEFDNRRDREIEFASGSGSGSGEGSGNIDEEDEIVDNEKNKIIVDDKTAVDDDFIFVDNEPVVNVKKFTKITKTAVIERTRAKSNHLSTIAKNQVFSTNTVPEKSKATTNFASLEDIDVFKNLTTVAETLTIETTAKSDDLNDNIRTNVLSTSTTAAESKATTKLTFISTNKKNVFEESTITTKFEAEEPKSTKSNLGVNNSIKNSISAKTMTTTESLSTKKLGFTTANTTDVIEHSNEIATFSNIGIVTSTFAPQTSLLTTKNDKDVTDTSVKKINKKDDTNMDDDDDDDTFSGSGSGDDDKQRQINISSMGEKSKNDSTINNGKVDKDTDKVAYGVIPPRILQSDPGNVDEDYFLIIDGYDYPLEDSQNRTESTKVSTANSDKDYNSSEFNSVDKVS